MQGTNDSCAWDQAKVRSVKRSLCCREHVEELHRVLKGTKCRLCRTILWILILNTLQYFSQHHLKYPSSNNCIS